MIQQLSGHHLLSQLSFTFLSECATLSSAVSSRSVSYSESGVVYFLFTIAALTVWQIQQI